MKASAIRIDVGEVVRLERAEPPVAIATAVIKFQLSGKLSVFHEGGVTNEKRQKLERLLFKALQEIELD